MNARLLAQSGYQPGDPAPEGYLAWHEWASVQHKAGLRQETCSHCSLWKYPQELSTREKIWHATNRQGQRIRMVSAVCLKCEAKMPWPWPTGARNG